MALRSVRPVALGILLMSAALAAGAAETPATESKPAAEAAPKVTCRTVKMTGSNLRTRKVCSTADSQSNAGDWVRQQQDRGGLNASAVLNNGN